MRARSFRSLVLLPLIFAGACSRDRDPTLAATPAEGELAAAIRIRPLGFPNDSTPLAGSVGGVPSLIQGVFGNSQQGNFELIVPSSGAGLLHYFRRNDLPGVPWGGPIPFGSAAGGAPARYQAVSLIQGTDQKLEVAARAGASLLFFERSVQGAWSAPVTIATNLDAGVSAAPVLLQSKCGASAGPGNFEVAVPNARAGIDFYTRDNARPGTPWITMPTFGQQLGKVDAVTMIESDYGSPGNFDLVARVGSSLYGWWRNPCGSPSASPPWNLIPGVLPTQGALAGNLVMIQSRFGHTGRDFNLLVPSGTAGVEELQRDNSGPAPVWKYLGTFAAELGSVTGVTLIESHYGSPGNLEASVVAGNALWSAFRDAAGWHVAPLASPVDPVTHPPAPYTTAYTERTDQLTGTIANPTGQQPGGIYGTDLGASFERNGALVFLSGDTHTAPWSGEGDDSSEVALDANFDREFAATSNTSAIGRFAGPRLDWGARFSFLDIDGAPPATGGPAGQLPVEGIALSDATYVFWMAASQPVAGGPGWTPTRTVLTKTDGPSGSLASLSTVFTQSSAHFINVSALQVGDDIYLYGTGEYRQSAVFLAKARASTLGDPTSWVFFRGTRGGVPQFGPGEDSAMPVTDDATAGELSVRADPTGGYLMMANLGPPDVPVYGTVALRWAANPWGPWSAREAVFVPTRDGGYERFLHSLPSDICHFTIDGLTYDDGLAESPARFDCTARQQPARPEIYDAQYHCVPPAQLPDFLSCDNAARGSSYGAYLMPRYFSVPSASRLDIAYTLSSWNPYQIHVMRTALTRDRAAIDRPAYGQNLPRAQLVNAGFTTGDVSGWQSDGAGGGFSVVSDATGRRVLTTAPPGLGVGAKGRLYQCIQVDATTSSLRFSILGGAASVRLIHLPNGSCADPCTPMADGSCASLPAVRESWGDGAPDGERRVQWTIDDLRGEWVELVVEDERDDAAGYIQTTGFTLQ